MAIVEYKGDQLNIDASLLTDFQFRVDSLYEFIGEIQASGRQRANWEREERVQSTDEGGGRGNRRPRTLVG